MHTPAIAVTKLFRVDEKQRIVAHLASFDWDFAQGEVRLACGDENLFVRQIGSGDHEGRAVVVLLPHGSWNDAVEWINRIQERAEEILIKR